MFSSTPLVTEMVVVLLGSAGSGKVGLGCRACWDTVTTSSSSTSSSAARLLSEIKLCVKETEEDVSGVSGSLLPLPLPLPHPLPLLLCGLECRMNCSQSCEVDCCLLARRPRRSAVCHRPDSLTAPQYEQWDDKFSDQDTRELSGPPPAPPPPNAPSEKRGSAGHCHTAAV